MQASKTLNRDPVLDVEGDVDSRRSLIRKALAAVAVLAVALIALVAVIALSGDDSPSRDQTPSVSSSVVPNGSSVADEPVAGVPSSAPVDVPYNGDWTTPAD